MNNLIDNFNLISLTIFDTSDECKWFELKINTQKQIKYSENKYQDIEIDYNFYDILTIKIKTSESNLPFYETMKIYLQTDFKELGKPIYKYNFIDNLDSMSNKNFKEHFLKFNIKTYSILYLGIYFGDKESKPDILHIF